ncbi:MAG: 1,4-dihydroxy-6-naphthoate synthase [Prevotellaceae bacterium]|jgi:1,4-dihydroxy-6-naphthoate synthase|nr:1,4-dihydroxy-6-naphthoate synthase [Prevotellaceae bacterium]
MKLQLCFSTCPNDTFVFDAMVHHKIDTEGLDFEIYMADVEELNKQAFFAGADVTKLSFNAYSQVSDKYMILNSGSALGRKNGPLLVSKTKIYKDEVDELNIAVPGKNTTAAALLQILFPKIKKLREYLFSDIESAVLDGEVDAGVLIHEGRFTYKRKDLKLVADLGELWETETQQAIPLGCIAIKRNLSAEVQQKFDAVLRKSVEFAMKNPDESLPFVRKHAKEMDDETMKKHINLFVNDFTVNLGKKGKEAIEFFIEKLKIINASDTICKPIFVENSQYLLT